MKSILTAGLLIMALSFAIALGRNTTLNIGDPLLIQVHSISPNCLHAILLLSKKATKFGEKIDSINEEDDFFFPPLFESASATKRPRANTSTPPVIVVMFSREKSEGVRLVSYNIVNDRPVFLSESYGTVFIPTEDGGGAKGDTPP